MSDVLTEIADWEDRFENRLQSSIQALRGQLIHLQEALVGFPLDIDQIRESDRPLW